MQYVSKQLQIQSEVLRTMSQWSSILLLQGGFILKLGVCSRGWGKLAGTPKSQLWNWQLLGFFSSGWAVCSPRRIRCRSLSEEIQRSFGSFILKEETVFKMQLGWLSSSILIIRKMTDHTIARVVLILRLNVFLFYPLFLEFILKENGVGRIFPFAPWSA